MYGSYFRGYLQKKIWRISFLQIVIFLVAIVAGFFLYFGGKFLHSKWVVHRDEKAFSELMDLFERIKGGYTTKNSAHFREISLDCEVLSKKYSHTSLFPYFILCKVVAILGEGKRSDEAIKSLEQICLPHCHLSEDLRNFVNFLRSVSFGDTKHDSAEIARLVLPKKSIFHELSLFIAGITIQQQNSVEEAEAIWSIFFKDPVYKASPFKQLVEMARNWDF